MAKRGFIECPVCGAEVNAQKLNRHLRKVHPKHATQHGAKRPKGRKAKVLSTRKQEMLDDRKRKERTGLAIKVGAVIVVCIVIGAIYMKWDDLFPEPENPVVVMETTYGTIEFELYEKKVPDTVDNFKRYVKTGFYEGLIFHRVTNLDSSRPSTAIVQGGGFEPGMKRKEPTYPEIPLEVHKDLTHVDGAVAMARTDDPDTASSQFYFCDGDQHFLDDSVRQSSGQGRGYAVFGQVIKGMDVVRAIANVETHTEGGYQDVPVENIIMTKVYLK